MKYSSQPKVSSTMSLSSFGPNATNFSGKVKVTDLPDSVIKTDSTNSTDEYVNISTGSMSQEEEKVISEMLKYVTQKKKTLGSFSSAPYVKWVRIPLDSAHSITTNIRALQSITKEDALNASRAELLATHRTS